MQFLVLHWPFQKRSVYYKGMLMLDAKKLHFWLFYFLMISRFHGHWLNIVQIIYISSRQQFSLYQFYIIFSIVCGEPQGSLSALCVYVFYALEWFRRIILLDNSILGVYGSHFKPSNRCIALITKSISSGVWFKVVSQLSQKNIVCSYIL